MSSVAWLGERDILCDNILMQERYIENRLLQQYILTARDVILRYSSNTEVDAQKSFNAQAIDDISNIWQNLQK